MAGKSTTDMVHKASNNTLQTWLRLSGRQINSFLFTHSPFSSFAQTAMFVSVGRTWRPAVSQKKVDNDGPDFHKASAWSCPIRAWEISIAEIDSAAKGAEQSMRELRKRAAQSHPLPHLEASCLRLEVEFHGQFH